MEYNSPEFRKWLDKLQQESWQLELIISGFAIYGLIMAYGPIEIKMATSVSADLYVFSTLWMIVLLCCQILIFNLVIHVLLRGLWIGAIGLRYVSGDIDYEELNYSEKFTKYLKRKVGSFDKYIARLENYCSVLFSISFLLIFYVIGFFSVFLFLAITLKGLRLLDFISEGSLEFIEYIFLAVTVFGTLIVLIDFLTQGFLKKKKWTSKLYFPIYWVFSKLTLSFLYRPLAYNFLDNKFGKRLSMLLVPIYIVVGSLTSITYINSNYLNQLENSSKYYADKSNYEDESIDEEQFINFASIPSKVISTPYLKVFVKYSEIKEDFIFEKNDKLKPEKDLRGVSHDGVEGFRMGSNEKKDKETIANEYLDYLTTVNELYKLRIDSLAINSDFLISKNAKDQIGFETYVTIRNLKEGKHFLTITGPIKNNASGKTENKVLVTIPFWYYPENSSAAINNQIMEVDSLTNK